eukprot:9462952-Pyramimonas_sp.AAC.1
MVIGCSVNDAAQKVTEHTSGLLGLWWRPAPKKKLSMGARRRGAVSLFRLGRSRPTRARHVRRGV